MTNNTFTDKELIKYRKEHYWRGFKVSFWLIIIVALGLVLFIKNENKKIVQTNEAFITTWENCADSFIREQKHNENFDGYLERYKEFMVGCVSNIKS